MLRSLYAYLLLMHPPAFRRRFAAEMLCVFDQAEGSAGAIPLIADGVVSLGRQWILRSGSWKLALALIGACLQITAGGLIWVALGDTGRLHKGRFPSDLAALEGLMRFILASVVGIVLLVVAASLWVRSFVRERS